MSAEVSARLLLYFKLLDYINKNKLGYAALPSKEKMSWSQKIDFSGMKVYTSRALCNRAVSEQQGTKDQSSHHQSLHFKG